MRNIKVLFLIFLFLIYFLNCAQEPATITETIQAGTVYPPQFSPSGGEFGSDIYIEISPNAQVKNKEYLKRIKIIYTTDGKNPEITKDGKIIHGSLYSGRILIDKFTIVKALCYADGVISDISRTAYSFKAAYPLFTPSTGNYALDQVVEISSATLGATIYYTTDGTNPSQSSNIYVTPLTISSPVTIKAIAYKFGWAYSETKEAIFTFQPGSPAVYPPGGIYDATLDVTLSPSLIGSEIRYTLDNSDPTETSALYTAPVLIDSSKILKAIAIKTGMENSEIAIAQYNLKVPDPYPDLGGGYYKTGKTITLSCNTSAAQIKYKLVDLDVTNDLTPDINYTVPINITTTKKLICMATKAGFEDSDWVYNSYVIDGSLNNAVSPPNFSHDSGTYTGPFYLTLSSSDGSSIKYTLDGSTPSSNSGLGYDSSLFITESTKIKAICFKDNYEYSTVVEKNYIISGQVETPIVSVESGTYNSAIIVEIDSPTSYSIVRWTIDGTEPDENSFVYNGPLSMTGSAGSITLKVKAFRKDWTPSETVTMTYDFKLPMPVFNPESRSDLTKPLTIVISQPVLGATIYYTDDGTDPETSGTRKTYTGPFVVSSTTTIKAYSTFSGWQDSDVSEQVYTFK